MPLPERTEVREEKQMAEAKNPPLLERAKKVGKLLVKWGLIGLVAIIGIKMIVPENIVKEMPTRADSGRQYAAHHNWSKDERDFFVKEVVIPDGSNGWVSIAVPPYYRMETSRAFDVEYDFGRVETVKEGPELPRVEVGDFPSTFDVKAVGGGGVLKITLHKNPTGEK